MMEQFRTRVWEDGTGQEWLGSVPMDTTDQEMRDCGYEYVEQVTLHLEDRSIHIRLYERCPPTLREAGDAMKNAIEQLIALSCDRTRFDVLTDMDIAEIGAGYAAGREAIAAWRKVVEREEAR